MAGSKLDSGQLNLLRLIVKGADAEGWAPVSALIYRNIIERGSVPQELATWERVGDDGRGRIRLTVEGTAVLDAAAWFV